MNDSLMIEVSHLTKRYAGLTAVRDLSFSVRRGEIVGLLGPNGAGKSTTMRILTCYLPATAGTVRVAGWDVFQHPDEVRRCIGYMPENNPLYDEMRVCEYLRFRARLKGLSRRRVRERVRAVMEQFELTEVHRKLIGHLSKGYRQRVGLADALVHEPELIILDEPTIGLDPSQIRAVRECIKELGRTHTVLLSTHILPEVEMTCDRVLILYEGRKLAEGTPDDLQQLISANSQIIAEIAAPLPELQACWEQMPEVESFEISAAQGDYYRCALTPRQEVDLRPQIFALARERHWALRELTRNRHSLEDIYLRITRPDQEEL